MKRREFITLLGGAVRSSEIEKTLRESKHKHCEIYLKE
jgi:hypothetical protein